MISTISFYSDYAEEIDIFFYLYHEEFRSKTGKTHYQFCNFLIAF